MSKKKNTKLLLVMVILIYGAIVARFLILRSKGDNDAAVTNPIAHFTPANYEVKEEFIIQNNHRDPFLGTLLNTLNPKKSTKKVVSKTKTTAYYPSVQYLGIVSDTQSNKKVVSLIVNDKEFIVREGSVVDSVKVLSGSSKELKVSYEGDVRKFKISS